MRPSITCSSATFSAKKLEHVGAALAEGAELLGRRGSEAEWDAWAMAAEAVVGIQRRQLELIQQEVGAAQSRLESCFEGINEESRSLAAALGQWRLTTGTEAAGASPLAVLANDAQRVEVLHAEGQSLQAGARAKAQQAAEALARLEQHLSQVTAINRDMHLQALNAIIKTASLGAQGATLEVLSMNVGQLVSGVEPRGDGHCNHCSNHCTAGRIAPQRRVAIRRIKPSHLLRVRVIWPADSGASARRVPISIRRQRRPPRWRSGSKRPWPIARPDWLFWRSSARP